ncbi:MAG: histidinol-phosphate transaminase [Candidatus Dadabacteria bacterium]|nr:histidinol-phosphate transaminase [Candidatus Dadabacteria bacterium]
MKPRDKDSKKTVESVLESRLSGRVRGLSAYSVPHRECSVRLDGNESPFPLPTDVAERVVQETGHLELNRYPDPEAHDLRALLSGISGFPSGGIILGNGSDEIIGMLVTAFTGGTGKVVCPAPTFSMYRLSGLALGATILEPGLDDRFDLDMAGMRALVEEKDPDIIFLASPNNPTGNAYSEDRILEIINLAGGLVVVDEAYADFSGRSFLPLVREYGNLAVMRTLSKIGFAGLRLGMLYAGEGIVHEINKVRYPYNINSVSQCAARVVLENREFIAENVRLVVGERGRVFAALSETPGIEAFPSDANFILFRAPDADAVFEGLIERDVLIRNFNRPGRLENCLRVTIGTPGENDAFLAALRGALSL